MFKPYRNKSLISALTLLFVLLFGTHAAEAARRHADHRISYRTQLGNDLDGDRIPETATIHECGDVYRVSIHFTTGKPKLRLTTHVSQGMAGLSLQTTDVDNDSQGDLVIVSATSLRPIGIWLNKGKAKFQKVNSWSFGVGRYTGPEYRHPQRSQVEPDGSNLSDPLPQTTPTVEFFSLEDSPDFITFQPDQLLFDSTLRQVPSRGPPPAARI